GIHGETRGHPGMCALSAQGRVREVCHKWTRTRSGGREEGRKGGRGMEEGRREDRRRRSGGPEEEDWRTGVGGQGEDGGRTVDWSVPCATTRSPISPTN